MVDDGTCQCDPLFAVDGMGRYFAPFFGFKQGFISWENGGGMTVFAQTEQNKIKFGVAINDGKIHRQLVAVAFHFLFRIGFTLNAEDVFGRNVQWYEDAFLGASEIAVRMLRRNAALITQKTSSLFQSTVPVSSLTIFSNKACGVFPPESAMDTVSLSCADVFSVNHWRAFRAIASKVSKTRILGFSIVL